LLLAGGVIVWALGDVVWDIQYTWARAEPASFGLADVFYLTGYPVLGAALIGFLRSHRFGWIGGRGAALDTAIFLTPICAFAWVVVIDPVIEAHAISGTDAVQLVYPCADLVLIGLLLRLGAARSDLGTSFWSLVGGFALLLSAHTLTSSPLLTGDYALGGWVDAFFLLAYIAWGAAALVPSMTALTNEGPSDGLRLSGRRVAVLALAILVSASVLLAKSWSDSTNHLDQLVLAVAATIVPLLVLLRLAEMLHVAERSTAEAEAARHNLEAVVRSSPLPMCVLDLQGRVQLWNQAVANLLGWPSAEVVGRQIPVVPAHDEAPERLEDLYRRMLAGEPLEGVEISLLSKSHERVEVSMSTTAVRDDCGRMTGIVSAAFDLTERNHQAERIRYLASHDPLTQLPNRRAFEQALEEAVGHARRRPGGSVLVVDLDNFKLVNDSAGHPAGDRYLVAVAELLASAVRPQDLVARLGGDEFGVLLESVSLPESRAVCERLLEMASEFRLQVAGQELDLGLSIGLAQVDGSEGVDATLARADAALYTAKAQGKNRYVMHAPTATENGEGAVAARLAVRIKDALHDDRLSLKLQPIVDLSTGEACFAEALIRMRDRSGALVHPDAFLPAAERFGLMPRIDRWIVETAFELLERHDDLRLFVNLTGSSLADDSLLELIAAGIRRHRFEEGRLGFEVTETAAVRDLQQASKRLGQLASLGCPIAIDDFGTGFSSFAHLKLLPASYVKIGESFVRNLESSATNQAIVRAIVEVAHALDKKVIAEAVESRAAARLVAGLGIELGQGYAFGRPTSASRWSRTRVARRELANVS
jgi:diguanylate cyclase (GGDEF)-like protein/PAS domain S-box-containing protein